MSRWPLLFLSAIPTLLQAQSSPIARAAWLAGCWELRAPGRVTTEMWMPPLGGSMLGASRTAMGEATREFEHLRLVSRGDTLVYIALPSGQQLTEFKSTSITDTSIVFENKAHDFPQVIRYRARGSDSLYARIEGPGPNATTRGINFPMRRVSCTEPLAAPPPAPPADSLIFDARFSPDGQQIAMVKGLRNDWEIFTGKSDFTSMRAVTGHPAVDYQPSWSPDGRRIAFTSAREGHQEIYTMRPDGSALTQLTRGSAHSSEPAWSPDGRRIVFRSERDGRPQIYLMNADGSDQRPLTQGATGGGSPVWSNDGTRIAYATTESGHAEIAVIKADGSARRVLTETPQTGGTRQSGGPQWSPDGKMIAFVTNRDGNFEVYVMNADGSNVRNLTNHPSNDAVLGWPRSGLVVFRSTRDRQMNDIYAVHPEGTNLKRLTTTARLAR